MFREFVCAVQQPFEISSVRFERGGFVALTAASSILTLRTIILGRVPTREGDLHFCAIDAGKKPPELLVQIVPCMSDFSNSKRIGFESGRPLFVGWPSDLFGSGAATTAARLCFGLRQAHPARTLGSKARKRKRLRCSSLVDWPGHPRLRRTMQVSERARNSGRTMAMASSTSRRAAKPLRTRRATAGPRSRTCGGRASCPHTRRKP